jgi:hypothetical protein
MMCCSAIFGRRVAPVCAFIILAGLFAGSSASGQNLVANAEFDHDITGWAPYGDTVVALHRPGDGSDLAGGSGPGCLEVQHFFWNGGSSGPEQVVGPVVEGAYYDFKGSYYLPSENNVADGVTIAISWRDADGFPVLTHSIEAWPLVTDEWTRLEEQFVAPAAAVDARVRLLVGNPILPDETEPGIAYFDDIWLAEEGVDAATQILFIPAAASVQGLGGTFWSTNGWFSNLVGFPVTVSGAFLRQGQDNTQALQNLTELGVVPPMGFLQIDDIVGSLGGNEEAGGVYLVATAEAGNLPATLISGTTHTFTPNTGGDGVYGQGLAAVPAGVSNMVIAPGAFQGSVFRTNVGALNTSAETVTLSVRITDDEGVEVAAEVWTLPPYSHRQKSLAAFGTGPMDGGTVKLTRTSNTGSFRAYTSTVDQSTGDAVYNEAR